MPQDSNYINYSILPEEELKARIKNDFFDYKHLDADKIIGKIDFCISLKKSQDKANNLAQNNIHNSNTQDFGDIYLLWAEAKKGVANPIDSFIQLILTIGKQKAHEKYNPPKFLGAFDAEKIAFIEFDEAALIFTQNNFDWTISKKITPSNHDSKEFTQLKDLIGKSLAKNQLLFRFKEDKEELEHFIKNNFASDNIELQKIKININNFILIYQKWLQYVRPSINVDWAKVKKAGILDADFYLADLLSKDNETIIDKLFVILKNKKYNIRKDNQNALFDEDPTADFNDERLAHTIFWNHYERPPEEKWQKMIKERRDQLVPSDVRELKGAFFTPQIWVQKAQEYLASAFGKDYQSEYFIWDCAAGTGNLLTGLSNSRNIFASTLDEGDIGVMKSTKSLPLLENHIFQFDFLNDSFIDSCEKHKIKEDMKQKEIKKILEKRENCKRCEKAQKSSQKIPAGLKDILADPAKRKNLIIFINPPYAEGGNQRNEKGGGKKDVAKNNAIYKKYKDEMGFASNELYAQFFFRIYKEIEGCKLASFSKVKYLNATNFIRFREMFKARFLKGFICPANTFDNVNGNFPISFIIWDLAKKEEIKKTTLDVYDNTINKLKNKNKIKTKKIFYAHNGEVINKWYKSLEVKHEEIEVMGVVTAYPNDFQQQNRVYLSRTKRQDRGIFVTKYNLIPSMVYLAVRHCIKATWLNDRDQFLAPKDSWLKDSEFHFNCLVFSLFHGQNRISSFDGVNYFIPFSETQINAKEAFASDFMYKFLQGKIGKDLAGGVRGLGRNKSFKEGEAEASHLASDVKGRGLEKTESKNQNKEKESALNDNCAQNSSLFESQNETLKLLINLIPQKPVIFSELAQKVMDAGRELFTYYHESASQPPKFSFDDGYNRSYNANASLYDIKAHFQGFKNKKMNPPQKAQDEHYNILLSDLNNALENLADEIAQKCYEHEFLLD